MRIACLNVFRLNVFAPMLMLMSMVSGLLVSSTAEARVRDRAAFRLNFGGAASASDPPSLADAATVGAAADAVTAPAGVSRIADVFAIGSVDSAIILDPARQQLISVADSADLSRPDAVTIAGLFVSLHAPDDNVFRGLFAKRQPDGAAKTNYGVNYNPATDALQVYVNDGSGFKIATFVEKATLGYRRRVHLAVTFSASDAPGADTDTDPDDVRIQLFVNGVAVPPTSAPVQEGSACWLTDVTLSSCVSDSPLTIGSSFLNSEAAHLICDEFQIFSESLAEADAATLFREILGANADAIAAEQSEVQSQPVAAPQIGTLSQYGLTIGQTNRLVVQGTNLSGARLHMTAAGVSVTALEGSSSEQALFDVTIAANTVPGRYLMRLTSAQGVSAARMISVDQLKQYGESQFIQASPAVEYPIAISGSISGTEQKRVYFSGKAGQKLVAEIEARRLGSGLDPVVEIKTATASPIAIQWQQPDLAGDARAIVTLPTDGLYFVEVHDLQYRAPAGSFWRLLLGDLPSASVMFPPVFTSASSTVRSAGLAGISEPLTLKTDGNRVVVESGASVLPLSALVSQSGTDITEPLEGSFEAAAVDAAFTTPPFRPLFLNGRITKPGETDQVLLTVTPGQALNFFVATQRFSSPLRAELFVFNGDALVASSNGASGTTEASADYTVAEGVTQLRVQIRDFTGRGSAAAVYRLQVARKDRPGFLLQTRDASIRLPANGSIPLRLSVTRQSDSFRYTGAIRLSVPGIPGINLIPDQIAASDQNQDVIMVLTRSVEAGLDPETEIAILEIEGQTQGLDPNISSRMTVPLANLPTNSLTFADNSVVSSRTEAVPATVMLESLPPILFRGIPAVISVRALPLTQTSATYVRYAMTTTEATRPQDPQKPDAGLKPLVAAADFQVGRISDAVFPLQISVPADVAATTLDAVIRADFVNQPVASVTGSGAWTAPIRLAIENAATVIVPEAPTKASRLATVAVTGTLKRHPQFSEPVTVTVDGLPAGYSAPAVTVPLESGTFTVSVTVPEQATQGDVPNVTIRGMSGTGSVITPATPLKLTVE